MSDPAMPPQELIERMAKDCMCCAECGSPPCEGCMAGGVCDQLCWCDGDETEDDGSDEETE